MYMLIQYLISGDRGLAVELVERAHHLIPVLQGDFLPFGVPHGAEGEVKGAQSE